MKFFRNVGISFYKNFNKSAFGAKLFLEQLSKGIQSNRCILHNLENFATNKPDNYLLFAHWTQGII